MNITFTFPHESEMDDITIGASKHLPSVGDVVVFDDRTGKRTRWSVEFVSWEVDENGMPKNNFSGINFSAVIHLVLADPRSFGAVG